MCQELSKAEDLQRREDHDSKDRRAALLRAITARARIGAVLEKMVRREQFDSQKYAAFVSLRCLVEEKAGSGIHS